MKTHPGRCLLLVAVLLSSTAVLAATEVEPDEEECADAWITTKLKTKLMGKIGTGAFYIDIDTKDCVVTLSGCVKTEEAEAKAIEVAQQMEKVQEVKAQLAFCPKKLSDNFGSDCPDNAVTSDVKLLLNMKDDLRDFPILVETQNCRVQLFGCVDTREQEKEVIRLAKKMSPKKKAKSHLLLCEEYESQ
jgi:hyperosmotically inducible periplasmic protein